MASSTRLVAWNPSNEDQFALCGSQLELWTISHSSRHNNNNREASVQSASRLATHVACMDWQKVEDGAFLAYGTLSENIGLIKWNESSANHEVG